MTRARTPVGGIPVRTGSKVVLPTATLHEPISENDRKTRAQDVGAHPLHDLGTAGMLRLPAR